MGVPKFYRWLSERYPCLSQVIREHQIPEFDNLYLDMNGIIHPCSHPNNDDPHFRITEGEIFKNIFNYIEVLFRIIKPKKNFFMAVDGCAPRAKMNQQRSRRFRTAKEAEDNIRKALQKGQVLPTEERFDSNCITPGTEFMARLQLQLQYFVNHKISTDPMWQQCDIYLSGHNVPGEGEHKIMDFVRYSRSQPGYDPNTRHCLYGLDADLVMLGLSSHEPYFSLLREEVQFGKQAKRMVRPENQTFHLLHLSLLREYIDMEFSAIAGNLHFRYDLERIIDDWIMLGFLVGNDFVPHLPNLHINQDALPFLFKCYKEFIVTSDGYMNESGLINLNRLKKYFGCLSKFDRSHFEDVYADSKWLESKGTGKLLEEYEKFPGKSKGKKFSEIIKGMDASEFPTPVKSKNPYEALANISGAFDDFSFAESPAKPTKDELKNKTENEDDVEIEDEEAFELEFKQHKRHYYMEKFDMDIVDDDQIQTICHEYLRALQWICHYYFNGLQSWSWYYPYHYSPYISDVANSEVKELRFDMSQPFHPFEQLLAVLPAASKKLLPEAFQNLMIADTSPIIDFYPSEFRTDLNGKQQDWEAVVLIPFIDEKRLLKAMNTHNSRLTDEEKERNSFGCCFKYRFDKDLNFVYQSSYPTLFEDISVCRAKVEEISREFYHLDVNQLKKGILKGTKLDVYFHGFPTMKHINHTCYLKRAGVRVFQQNSRYDNAIVKVLNDNKPVVSDIAAKFIGETVYVEWPYMVEGLVVSMSDESSKYFLDENDQLASSLLKDDDYKKTVREMKSIETTHFNRKGIELGKVQVLVEVKLLLGKRYVCNAKGAVHLNKEWAPHSNFYAFQATVKDLQVHSTQENVCSTIDSLYPPGLNCFMLGFPHYGSCGEVIECKKDEGRIRVALKVIPEPDFNTIMKQYDRLAVHYISDFAVAQRVGISTQLLSRITGDVMVYVSANRRDFYNLGLKLKYSGQNKEVIGYARRSATGWTYSPATIEMLKVYMNKFPEVFEMIGKINDSQQLIFQEIWPRKNESYLEAIKSFLKTLPSFNTNPVRCGSSSLDEPVVRAIEDCIEEFKQSNPERKIMKVKVKPRVLFRPSEHFGSLSADPGTDFLLFDRVVNIQAGSIVPLGMRGTIVGLHEVVPDGDKGNLVSERKYEVMFDEEFLGGMKTRTLAKRCYFATGNSLINISFGERKEKAKNGQKVDSADFQNKISQPLKAGDFGNSKSQFSQRTPGILHTPPHLYKDATKKYSPNSSHKQSPNWLKGSYQSPSQYSHSHSPNTRSNQKKYSSPIQVQDNNDFMSMWQEMEKVKQQETSSSSVDQNATMEIHKMLRLDSHEKTPPKHYPSPQQSVPPGYQHPAANAKAQSSPGNRHNGQQFEKGSSLNMLYQFCAQKQLPTPNVAYTKTMQGVNAMIMIGNLYKYSGNTCVNEKLASESAAELALGHLSQFQSPSTPYTAIPRVVAPPQQFLTYPPTNLFRPAYQVHSQPFLYQSPRYNSPQQQPQRYVPNPQYQASNARKSNSTSNIRHNMPQQRASEQQMTPPARSQINQFIPHQVMVKKKAPYEAATTSINATHEHGSSAHGIAFNADNELKNMLGIKVANQGDELKELLGIGKPVSPQTAQKSHSDQDLFLKNMLGVPTTPTQSKEDIRIKSMLGIGTDRGSVTSNASNTNVQFNGGTIGNTNQIQPTVDPLGDLFSAFNISSNITTAQTPQSNLSYQSASAHQQTPIYSSPGNATAHESNRANITKSEVPVENVESGKPKKQILLAPSFFNAKKK